MTAPHDVPKSTRPALPSDWEPVLRGPSSALIDRGITVSVEHGPGGGKHRVWRQTDGSMMKRSEVERYLGASYSISPARGFIRRALGALRATANRKVS